MIYKYSCKHADTWCGRPSVLLGCCFEAERCFSVWKSVRKKTKALKKKELPMVTAGNQLPTSPAELINEQKKWTRNTMVGGNEGKPPQIIWQLSVPSFWPREGNDRVKQRADSGQNFTSGTRTTAVFTVSDWSKVPTCHCD